MCLFCIFFFYNYLALALHICAPLDRLVVVCVCVYVCVGCVVSVVNLPDAAAAVVAATSNDNKFSMEKAPASSDGQAVAYT